MEAEALLRWVGEIVSNAGLDVIQLNGS